MKVHNLTIDSSQRDTGDHQYSNNYIITLENPIYDVSEIRLISGCIPIPSTPVPRSLILRLSSGSDEFNQSVYTGTPKDSSQKGTPYYTGHIIVGERNTFNNKIINGSDDPFIHRFHSGPQKVIKDINVELFYMSSGSLVTYEVGSTDHVLKFEITCSTDKLEGLPKVPIEDVVEKKEEEKPISIPEVKNVYRWKKEYIYIALIVVVGLLLMFFMKRKTPKYPRKLSE